LCTFDFMQYSYEMYSSALSISFLFLFHYHIYFHLYILTYTYPFNLQSQKRIKKVLYSWVLNWVTKIVNYFTSFGPKKKKKKKEYPNPHEPVPIRATRGPAGWSFTMWVADLDFQTRSLRGELWKTCKFGPIRPAPTPTCYLLFSRTSPP